MYKELKVMGFISEDFFISPNKEKWLFISRHEPNDGQKMLAKDVNIDLVHVGDLDAFSEDISEQIDNLLKSNGAKGVVAVHPIIVLNAIDKGPVGVFNNINRAPIGEPPRFETTIFKRFELSIDWTV